MKNLSIKPSVAVVVDVVTLTHVCQAGMADTLLVADLKRMGGIDALDKTFRTTYFIGRLMLSFVKGGFEIDQKAADWAFSVYQKANPKAKKGTKAVRTAAEQKAYEAAVTHFTRWRRDVGFPAVQSRKDAAEKEKKAKAKQATADKLAKAREKDALAPVPASLTATANNAQNADRFIRMQAAMLLAYCEKNRAMVPDAIRDAVAELVECVKAVPPAELEADEA